jgi:hypothetical protein
MTRFAFLLAPTAALALAACSTPTYVAYPNQPAVVAQPVAQPAYVTVPVETTTYVTTAPSPYASGVIVTHPAPETLQIVPSTAYVAPSATYVAPAPVVVQPSVRACPWGTYNC